MQATIESASSSRRTRGCTRKTRRLAHHLFDRDTRVAALESRIAERLNVRRRRSGLRPNDPAASSRAPPTLSLCAGAIPPEARAPASYVLLGSSGVSVTSRRSLSVAVVGVVRGVDRHIRNVCSSSWSSGLNERSRLRTVGPVIEERLPQRLTMTVEEAAVVLGASRATAYDNVSRGEIPCIRISRRILIPKVALERLLEGSGKTGV